MRWRSLTDVCDRPIIDVQIGRREPKVVTPVVDD